MVEKGLIYFTIASLCVWLIIDEFAGNGFISNFTNMITGRAVEELPASDHPQKETEIGPKQPPRSGGSGVYV